MEQWTFVSWANNSVCTQSCLTPLGCSAGRSDRTRRLYVRVLDSTGKPRMNKLSKTGFARPSVKITFCLLVFLVKHSGDMFSMLWRKRARIVLQANSSVGEQPCLTPLRQPALRPEAPRPWNVWVFDSQGPIVGWCSFYVSSNCMKLTTSFSQKSSGILQASYRNGNRKHVSLGEIFKNYSTNAASPNFLQRNAFFLLHR